MHNSLGLHCLRSKLNHKCSQKHIFAKMLLADVIHVCLQLRRRKYPRQYHTDIPHIHTHTPTFCSDAKFPCFKAFFWKSDLTNIKGKQKHWQGALWYSPTSEKSIIENHVSLERKCASYSYGKGQDQHTMQHGGSCVWLMLLLVMPSICSLAVNVSHTRSQVYRERRCESANCQYHLSLF